MMSKKTKNEQADKVKFDLLADLLKGTSPEKLKTLLVKSESLTIRLTLTDKTGMERAAKACGLTLTDYLTRLHYLVAEKLEGVK